MTPQAFSFHMTVPNDPASVTLAAAVAAHAAEYAKLPADAGAAFVEQVKAAASPVLTGGAGHTLIVFAAEGGRLVVTVGGAAVAAPLPA